MDMQSLLVSMLICLNKSTFALFRIRPSTTTSLTMAELRGTSCVKHDEMYSCFMGCLRDQCCLAVKLSPPCEISYLHTEELDIVKEVTDPPPLEQCSCMLHVGGTGGGRFSFKPQYVADPSPIVRLTVYTKWALGMTMATGVGMKFKSGEEGSAGETSNVETCDLVENERITRVTAYITKYYFTIDVLAGLHIQTTLKSCGTFETETDVMQVAEGHQLVYLEGGSGDVLDGLDLVFDHGCN